MAKYDHWAENNDQNMPMTDFDYIANHVADIIDGEIKSGNSGGSDTYPRVRKRIRLVSDLGEIEINEYINKTGVIEKFEYDWKYMKDKQWKFHFDTYHPKKYWTQTIHYHQHYDLTRINPNKIELLIFE